MKGEQMGKKCGCRIIDNWISCWCEDDEDE